MKNTTIAFMSDLHVVARKGHALNDIKKALLDGKELGISGLVLNGDLTDRAKPSQYETLKTILSSVSRRDYHMLINSGNHDLRGSNKDIISYFTKWRNTVLQIEHPQVFYEQAIDDVYFFMLNSQRPLKTDAFLSQHQLSWLKERLEIVAKTYKVIMLCCHQPMKCDLHLSDKLAIGAQENELHTILQRYNNIIYVSGHTHSNVSKCQIVKTDFGFALDIPSFHLCDHNFFKRGYGIVMQYSSEQIHVRYRNFVKQCWAKKSFSINLLDMSIVTTFDQPMHLLPFSQLTFGKE